MAVLAFGKAQVAHYVVSIFPSLSLLLFFTDETIKIFNRLIIILQGYINSPLLLITLYTLFGITSIFFINKRFIKKNISSLILSLFQFSVQSILIITILIIFCIVVIGKIQEDRFFWYLLFCLTIQFSIFNVVCINQYKVKRPKHLKTIEDLLIKKPRNNYEKTPHFMRPEGLLWCDFQAGLGIDREETLEIINTIKRKKYCTLIGHPASGKSVILRRTGFNLSKKNFIVFYVNAEWLDPEKSYLDIRKWNLPNTVLLIDDLHRNPSACSRFIQQLIGLKVKLILSSRDFDFTVLRTDERGIISKIMETKVETNVTREVIISLIEKYCIWKKIKAKIFKKDVDYIIEMCGNDLWIETYILLMWNPGYNRIRDISKKIIYDQIRTNRIKKWMSTGDKIIDTLIIISTLYQYEIPCSELFLNKKDLAQPALKLAEMGDIMVRGRYFVLHHSSVAKIYLETFEHYKFVQDLSLHTANLLLNYSDENVDDRDVMFYNMSLLKEPDHIEEQVIKQIASNINVDDIVYQIEKETDISKIISFLITVLKIDKTLAKNVISKVSLTFLEKHLNDEILISRRDEILDEFSRIDRNVSAKILKRWKKRIAVVHAFNLELHIKELLNFLDNYVDSIIVVDDGSTDLTGSIAANWGAFLIRHAQNRGLVESVMNGLNKAKEIGVDLVILFIDGFIEKFLRLDDFIRPVITDDFDLVVGSYQSLVYRFISGSSSVITMSSPEITKMLTSESTMRNDRVTRRRSRVGITVDIHVMNKKSIECYLNYLRREEFLTHGISISKILFSKILRVTEVKKTYPITSPRVRARARAALVLRWIKW